jgi:hypothetical protein
MGIFSEREKSDNYNLGWGDYASWESIDGGEISLITVTVSRFGTIAEIDREIASKIINVVARITEILTEKEISVVKG